MWQATLEFSIRHPRVVLALALVLSVGFAAQVPRIRADTNPKKILPAVEIIDLVEYLRTLRGEAR